MLAYPLQCALLGSHTLILASLSLFKIVCLSCPHCFKKGFGRENYTLQRANYELCRSNRAVSCDIWKKNYSIDHYKSQYTRSFNGVSLPTK